MSIRVTITKNTIIAHNIHKIEATVDSSTPLQFEAGQFTMVNIPTQLGSRTSKSDFQVETVPRAFSFGNSNNDPHNIIWYVKILEDKATGPHYASPYFKNCKAGDELAFDVPNGRMTLPDELPKKIVYIATTTGIAPFLSHLHKIADTSPQQNVEVIFGCRNKEDIFAQEELINLSSQLPNLTHTTSLSKPPDDWDGAKGRTTEHLSNIDNNALIYLCGNKHMIIDARKKLLKQNHNPQKIKFEIFY
ncbi:MAG: hypothetical protein CMI52_03535 [Parcubacteria group bacterium]|nr:hypothetical protein [Parcubacteria group bacterium]